MDSEELLMVEALRVYEGVSRKLESSILQRDKMPPRAARTMAYGALNGRINRLSALKHRLFERYSRRKTKYGTA